MGSNKTAMTIPGGSRVINVFDGNGAPPVPNFFLFFDAVRFLEVSQESPRVDTRRGQSPTPHARALPSVHTYKQGPLRSLALDHDLPKISIQSSLETPTVNVTGGAFREARGYVPGPLLWNLWSRRTTRMYSEFRSFF